MNELFPYIYQNGTVYGAAVLSSSGNTTQVNFYQYRRPTGATYGSAGETWGTSTRWRVRKISSGGQVGYPISSANIIGRTDGNAPAAGGVGQVILNTEVAVAFTASATAAQVDTITLPAGSWLVSAGSTLMNNASGTTYTGEYEFCISTITASVSGTIAGGYDYTRVTPSVTTANLCAASLYPMRIFNVSSPTTVYLNHRCAYSGGAPSTRATLRALRIA
jgi:hypothetical protein